MVMPAVPELFDDEQQSAVDTRTDLLQSLRELGPPDLVHLVKSQNKSPAKLFGVYHHVTGVDASSSASLAAYVNTLIHSPNDKQNKLTSGLYCCYNAFSRLDMRVQVTIPGSVESYCIDERGDKRVASDELWLETYLCSVLRAYSYADDGDGDAIRKIVGCRRFNPITSTESEHRFLEAAERLFFNGWQLGSDPEVQVPNLVSNHLTAGLLNYITTTGRYTSGINLFEKLRTRDPEISSLLARVLVAADEEVKAVRLLNNAVKEISMDYSLLDAQVSFCSSKGRNDFALELAKRAVIAAPSEFSTWSRLAEIYIQLDKWDLALLTLNSCPMFTYQDKDAPRTPTPDRVHLPILPETACDEIDDSTGTGEMDVVNPAFRKLVAATFKGTFHKAYTLLTEITKKIGWDQLLKIRSQVFVMEEEYRHERQGPLRANQNASTIALNGSPKPATDATSEEGEDDKSEPDVVNNDDENKNQQQSLNGATGITATTLEEGLSSSLEKPTHTATNPDTAGDNIEDSLDPSHATYTSFKHKRLCERWLDNLFMVLYEDLRTFTLWRTEMAQYRNQQIQYKKSADEWEILGNLAERLHYGKEAVEAYQQCLNIRFSPKSMIGVLRAWQTHGDLRGIVDAVIRLICWQYRWYSEFSPYLFKTIRRLIEEEGAVKIRSMVQSTNLPQHVLDLTHQYVALCAAFRSSGSDG